MKNNITAIIFGLSIVIASYILGNAFMNRNNTEKTISVTGLGQTDFTSDLIVWEGSFSKESFNLTQAYSDLEKEVRRLKKENGYLKEINKVLKKSTAIFSAEHMGGLK